MPRRFRAPFALALALTLAACAGAPRLALVPRVARFEVDGDFGAEEPDRSITATADASSLGLDEETAITPQIELDFDDLHFSAHFTRVEFSGDGRTDATLRFRGEEIPAGADVATDFDVSLLAGDVVYDLIPTGDVVDLGVGVGAGSLSYDLSVRTTSGPDARVQSDDTVPIGYLVVRLATAPGSVRFVGFARGITGTFQDDEATYLDLDGRIALELFSVDPVSVSAHLGYRYIMADYEHDGSDGRIEIDVSVSGPYVGVEIVF